MTSDSWWQRKADRQRRALNRLQRARGDVEIVHVVDRTTRFAGDAITWDGREWIDAEHVHLLASDRHRLAKMASDALVERDRAKKEFGQNLNATEERVEVAVRWPDGRILPRHRNETVTGGRPLRPPIWAHKGAVFVRRTVSYGPWEVIECAQPESSAAPDEEPGR